MFVLYKTWRSPSIFKPIPLRSAGAYSLELDQHIDDVAFGVDCRFVQNSTISPIRPSCDTASKGRSKGPLVLSECHSRQRNLHWP